jgi:hypothetical protein
VCIGPPLPPEEKRWLGRAFARARISPLGSKWIAGEV